MDRVELSDDALDAVSGGYAEQRCWSSFSRHQKSPAAAETTASLALWNKWPVLWSPARSWASGSGSPRLAFEKGNQNEYED